ncbi:Hypothetical predicted protein, partial [Paramuricea clavata]
MLENTYRLRGRRGGVKTKLDEARKRHNIPVHYTSCTKRSKFEYSNSNTKGVNFSNLIKIPICKDNNNQTVPHFVPRVMLSNVMSLTPKLDEVSEFLLRKKIDIGFITESWLKDRINDSIVKISGFNLIRKDRSSHEHGGVCIYLKDQIKYTIPENLQCCREHEVLWLKIHLNVIH